jgi:hypothetical protein
MNNRKEKKWDGDEISLEEIELDKPMLIKAVCDFANAYFRMELPKREREAELLRISDMCSYYLSPAGQEAKRHIEAAVAYVEAELVRLCTLVLDGDDDEEVEAKIDELDRELEAHRAELSKYI